MSKVKWSTRARRMLNLWLSQIGINRRAHQEAAVRMNNHSQWLKISSIFFGALATITSFSNIADFSKKIKVALTVTAAVAALIGTCISGIIGTLDMDKEANAHKNMADQYSDIANLIQITIIDHNKPELGTFLRDLVDRMRIIKFFGPDPTGSQVDTADLPGLILLKEAMVKNKKRGMIGAIKSPVDILSGSDGRLFMQDSNGDIEEFKSGFRKPSRNITMPIIHQKDGEKNKDDQSNITGKLSEKIVSSDSDKKLVDEDESLMNELINVYISTSDTDE